METKEVLKLVEAGFTADEIRGFLRPDAEKKESPEPRASLEPLSPEPTGAVENSSAPAEAPVKKPDVLEAVKTAVTEQMADVMKNYEETINKMARLAGMPSIAEVEPKGIEDIISGFFKEEK